MICLSNYTKSCFLILHSVFFTNVTHFRFTTGFVILQKFSETACREESVQALSILALKPRADVTRSPKQGYQWPRKKDRCPQNFFKKNSEMLQKPYAFRYCCNVFFHDCVVTHIGGSLFYEIQMKYCCSQCNKRTALRGREIKLIQFQVQLQFIDRAKYQRTFSS